MNLPVLHKSLLPTKSSVVALSLPVGLAVAALVAPVLLWAMLGVDLVLLLVLVVDAARTKTLPFRVVREAPRIWSANRLERITLCIDNPDSKAHTVEIHQTLFSGAEPVGLPLKLRVPAHGLAEGIFKISALKRGRYELGGHHLRYWSPWGFWQRQLDLPDSHALQVWPDVKQLAEYDLLAKSDRQGLLLRTSKKPGAETEFDRLRPYQRGDEYRQVDWKATARAQGPVVRQLRQATNQTVVFLLDCGRTMTAETAGRPALDYALDAALLLAHVAARQGDKSGVIGFDQSIRAWLPPTGGPQTSRLMLQTVCDLHAQLVEPDYQEAFNLLKSRVRQRSLVVLFSNLVDEDTAEVLQKVMKSAARHLIIWVCLRDPGVEALVQAPLSSGETPWLRGAAAEVLLWRKRILDRAQGLGVMVVDAAPGEFTPALLNRYLEIKARQLL